MCLFVAGHAADEAVQDPPKSGCTITVHTENICYYCRQQYASALQARAKGRTVSVKEQDGAHLFLIEGRYTRKKKALSWIQETKIPTNKVMTRCRKLCGGVKERVLLTRSSIHFARTISATKPCPVCGKSGRRDGPISPYTKRKPPQGRQPISPKDLK